MRGKYGDDWERIGRMSIIEDGSGDKWVVGECGQVWGYLVHLDRWVCRMRY